MRGGAQCCRGAGHPQALRPSAGYRETGRKIRQPGAACETGYARTRPGLRCPGTARSSSRPEAGTALQIRTGRPDRRTRESGGHSLRGRRTRTYRHYLNHPTRRAASDGLTVMLIRMIVNCIARTLPPASPPECSGPPASRRLWAERGKALSGGLPSMELGQSLQGRTCGVPRTELSLALPKGGLAAASLPTPAARSTSRRAYPRQSRQPRPAGRECGPTPRSPWLCARQSGHRRGARPRHR